MESPVGSGRVVGVLLLLQGFVGYVVNFVLLQPAMAAPGFLVNAAANSLQIGLAVLIGLATSALSVAIAIVAWPVFRQCSRAMTLWTFALAGVGFTLGAVENTAVLSMLSLSQEYLKADASGAGQFELLGAVVRSTRYWAHYMKLIVAVSMLLVFFGMLYRFALIPRALAGVALLATLLQLTAVTMPVFGHRIMFELLTPAGVTYLVVALWLIVRGFNDPLRPVTSTTTRT